MAVELGVGYVSILPSTRGLGRQISRELNGPLTSAGREAGDSAAGAFGGRFTAGITRAAKTAGIALGVAFAGAGTYGVKVAADFQQTRIAFEGILGSAEEANKRLTELQDFAAGTPFEFAGLAESAQQLLAVGFAADDIIPTMTTLGNVAATLGVGEAEIKGVVRALGQMRGKGKASAEELQQISEQIPGFSAIGAIAEDMGITTAAAFKLLEKGAIPANDAIESILAGMESFPGAAGAMERQSQTLNGVISTFKDTLNIALIEGIEPFLPAISGALQGAIPFVERFVSSTIGGIATAVSAIGDFGSLMGDIVGVIGEAFTALGDSSIGQGISDALSGLAGLVSDAAGAVLDALGPVALAFGATGILGGALVAGTGLWSDYRDNGINPVIAAYERIIEVLDPVTQAFADQRDILIPLTAAVAGFAGSLLIYTQAAQGIAAIAAAAKLVGPAIAGVLAVIASPVALIVAAVVAVAAAFAAAYFHIQPFRDAVDGLVDTVGGFVSGFIDDAVPALQAFAGIMADLGRSIATGFTRGVRALGGVIQRNIIEPLRPLGRFLSNEVAPAFEAFGAFVSALFARVSDVVGPALQILGTQLEFLAGIISDIAGPAFRVFAAEATAAFDIFRTVVETIANVLAPVLGLAFDALAAAVDVAWGIIVAIITAALDTIEGVFDILTGILTGDFAKVWEGIVEIVGAPFRAIQSIVTNTLEEIVGFIGTIPGRIGDFVTAIFGGAIDIASAIFGGFKDIITTTFEGIIEFVTGLPARIGTAASGMFDGIAEAFEGVLNFIINGWNSLEFTIPGFDPPGPGPKFDGFTLGLPQIDPVNFAGGGIVTARPGGLIGRLGEAGQDEAVIPLPSNFDISALANASGGPHLHVTQMPGDDVISTGMRELRRFELLRVELSPSR